MLISALDRAGDRAGAVRAYEQCRTVLGDELGIDPSRETVELYLSALRDRTLLGAGRLPTPTAHGRAARHELAELRNALRARAVVTRDRQGRRRQIPPGAAGRDRRHRVRGRAALGVARRRRRQRTRRRDGSARTRHRRRRRRSGSAIAAELAPLGRALLVLDGCEATRDGVASLVSALLMTCRQLSVLVTSRSPIGLEGEKVLDAAAFSQLRRRPTCPRSRQTTRCSCSSIGSPPRGGLLDVDAGNAPLVAALCVRCGGLPLALELAAAQLTVMSLPDLLDHLAVGGDDDQVRAVLERSYALLEADEAEVFRTFAILDGAVGLPLVRRVVSEERVPPMRVIRVLRELTAAGLMWVDRSGARWRYQMDDDVRRFASDELVAAGDRERRRSDGWPTRSAACCPATREPRRAATRTKSST